jgi:hypothetical protein
MPSTTDTLNKLYDKVVVKANKLKPEEVEEKEEKKDYKANSSPFQQQQGIDTNFQGKADEKPYKTNIGIGDLPAGGGGHNAGQLPSNSAPGSFDYSPDSETGRQKKLMRTKDGEEFEIREQGPDETPVTPPEEEEEPAGGNMELPADPATTAPEMNAQQDMGDIGAMGGDVGGELGMGMGMEEEQKSPHELGRIYELKKIYTRLTSIESYLASEADPELTDLRKYVSQSIELFEILASNIESYKDKMDEIIISYYKFLKEIYFEIRNYYKTKQDQLDEV